MTRRARIGPNDIRDRNQRDGVMTINLHAPTRRHLLLASGTLFAWAHLPKLARAEGRDPRLLVIVLRGALDGLAAVAPVGDPDWIALRGDKALTLAGKTPVSADARPFVTEVAQAFTAAKANAAGQ